MKCPLCGSCKTVEIRYGLPDFTEEVVRQIEHEEVYFGGCVISGGARYHCFGCGKNFGTSPKLYKGGSAEDYRKIVTGILYIEKGYPDGYREIQIRKEEERIWLDVNPGYREPDPFLHREMQPGEWGDLLQYLFCQIYLHEWPDRLTDIDLHAGETEDWELDLSLTNGRFRNYCGMSRFTPYNMELREAFIPFFREAGI